MRRGTPAAAAATPLLLLLWLLPLHAAAAAAGSGSCARSCGGLTVRYPFGFSPGCEIWLGCDQANGTAWLRAAHELGLRVSNVTARALVLTLLPDCSRRLNASVEALFSDNYAPGPQNVLLVSSCNRADRTMNCSVPPATYLNASSHCFHGANKAENFSCVSPPLPPIGNRFLNKTEIRALGSECTGLVSAASYWDAPAPVPAVLLGVMELEWWMGGPCSCAPNANCTPLTTPAAGQGFRCECREGFEGDGFAGGTGCRRVSAAKCNPSKNLAEGCGKTIQIALIVAGIVFGALVTGVTCVVYQLLKRRSASIRTKRSTKRLLSEASCAVPFYSYREIERATDGFSDAKRLGTGAYGTVYAGRLSDSRLVAVKRIRQRDNAGLDCVMNEVKLVSCVCHRNLVRLLGCCIEQGQQILVYEFMPNGTLAQHLQRERGPAAMPWTVRLRIAAETAKAIAYLHSEVDPPIYHRDVKSSNILLDYEYNSKVADFGLSRLGKAPLGDSSHISTAPQGTPGYVDPQYHQNFHLSDRSDVYSFGVVLVEIITAMKAVDLTRAPSEVNLAQLAVDRIGRGRVDDIVDPYLDPHRDAWTLSSIHKVAELAFRCLAFHSEMRPSMAEVADELDQMQRSGWAPSADDAAYMSTSSSICSSAASTRGTDRSWGAGRSRTDRERAAANALAAQEAAKGGAAESPVSVQERWFSDRSSPSSNSLLGSRPLH
ncbi:wall-associated receptor kinase-like 14 [Panicum miliaceum]|uniref:Wall-associated receptor kinase-like 14 n=1 Tax=Panicum miliaceum TaxID=4540 RepID=A0A3L6S8X3_PANMI|nr:wall-associated receptor kinase-like 14 [Panicum miliaceum]